MKSDTYYDNYWKNRLSLGNSIPIPSYTPNILKKYTAYGSILNQIPIRSTILDLGCGSGNVSQLYKQKGNVIGMDISEKALSSAKKLGIRTLKHDLNIYPYPIHTSAIDAIILTDVLEHLLDPLSCLRECRRIMTRGGCVILTVPNFARLGNRVRMALGDPIDLLHFEKYGDELEHFHWFTVPKMRHLVLNAGFTQIGFIPTGLQNLGFMYGLAHMYGLGNFLTVVCKGSVV